MSLESQRPAAPPRIVTPKGVTLSWDADDRLWLLRAVQAEGAPQALVAQTLVNRWAWLADEAKGKYWKLRELVRAYCQPVNPLWFPDGKLFQRALEKLPASEQPAALQTAQRRLLLSERTQFSPSTEAAVRQALYGPVTLPPGALHFAAPSIVRNDLPVLVPSHDGSNVIYGESQGRGSRALYSLTASADGASPQTSRAGVVVGLLTFGFGIALWSVLKPK